jgi:hypothetical protein
VTSAPLKGNGDTIRKSTVRQSFCTRSWLTDIYRICTRLRVVDWRCAGQGAGAKQGLFVNELAIRKARIANYLTDRLTKIAGVLELNSSGSSARADVLFRNKSGFYSLTQLPDGFGGTHCVERAGNELFGPGPAA